MGKRLFISKYFELPSSQWQQLADDKHLIQIGTKRMEMQLSKINGLYPGIEIPWN